MITYSEYIENLNNLTLPELKEINQIIKKIMVEKRRGIVLNNYYVAESELNNGELEFSSDIDTLMRNLG